MNTITDIRPHGMAIERDCVPYPDAVEEMESRVAAIRAGTAGELIWFVEHPPIYTGCAGAKAGDLLSPNRFPVLRHRTRRPVTPITRPASA